MHVLCQLQESARPLARLHPSRSGCTAIVSTDTGMGSVAQRRTVLADRIAVLASVALATSRSLLVGGAGIAAARGNPHAAAGQLPDIYALFKCPSQHHLPACSIAHVTLSASPLP